MLVGDIQHYPEKIKRENSVEFEIKIQFYTYSEKLFRSIYTAHTQFLFNQ